MGAAVNTTRQSTATAPRSVLKANPVIVGGGPVGLLTAILLDQHRIPVTLIEKQNDFNDFRISRQYFLVVFNKGRQAIQRVPGLWEFITKRGLVFGKTGIVFYKPDGSHIAIRGGPGVEDGSLNAKFLRSNLVNALKEYITEHCRYVTAMYGTSVKHVNLREDGEAELMLEKDNEESMLRSRLVLACDGKNSVVAESLLEAERISGRRLVQSSRGLHVVNRHSPAVGIKVKALLLNRSFAEILKDNNQDGTTSLSINVFLGNKNLPWKRAFNLPLFSVHWTDMEAIGGCLAGLARPPDHELWTLNSVEDAFSLLEENFPQMNIRKYITPENMKEFVECQPSTFGYVSRRNSLVASVGQESKGGVVLLGDAAHSFPPDIGQGVNAGMEDARLFVEVLHKSREDCGLQEVMQLYEQERDKNISALMRLAQFGNPYQYGQSKFRSRLHNLNALFRKRLANSFPGLMYPSMGTMIGDDLPYSEIARRADQTTALLLTLSVIIGVASITSAIAVSRMFG